MRKIATNLILLAIVCVTQSACKKGETPKDKTLIELLTQKPWVMVKWRLNYTGEWTDEFTNQPACDVDNIFTFKADHTAAQDMGAIKCNPDFPQTRIGKWSFSGYETYLSLKDVWLDDTFNIDELSENTLILRSHSSGMINEYSFAHP